MDARRILSLMSAVALVLGVAATSAQAVTSQTAQMAEVIELLQQDARDRDGVSTSYNDVLWQSQAAVNVQNGEIRFVVTDWPMGAPTAADTMIKGTLVCNVSAGAQATLVDTPAVPVNEHGQASFAGRVQLPSTCAAGPEDLAFFVRTTATTR